MTESTLDRLGQLKAVCDGETDKNPDHYDGLDYDAALENAAPALIAAARALEAMVEEVCAGRQCYICGRRKDRGHDSDCPVPAAQAALEALK